jgi:hypothetical protein
MRKKCKFGIQYASDLHLELYPKLETFVDILAKPTEPDVSTLVLCGDIGNLQEREVLRKFLLYCAATWENVFYIPGNHEYYHSNYDDANQQLDELCKDCGVTFALFHVHTIKRASGIDLVLIMSTLWSNIPAEHHVEVSQYIPDYSKIENFTPDRSNSLHKDACQKIKQACRQHSTSEIVIFTHHAPLMSGTSDSKFNQTNGKHAFATNCQYYMIGVSCWIFGHTHYNPTPFMSGKTLITSNQRGNQKYGGYGKTLSEVSYCPTKHLIFDKYTMGVELDG